MKVDPASAAARAAGQAARAAGPAVEHVVGLARQAARQAARRGPARVPHAGDLPISPADLASVRPTALLTDARQARAARRTAHLLGLPRGGDDACAWSALGALAVLLRVADDGRRTALVVDTGSPGSLFQRWADRSGFAPICLDVARPGVVGSRIDPGGVDLVASLHPRSPEPDRLDDHLATASTSLRRGGVVVLTTRLGRAQVGGLGVPEVRSLTARAGEHGLSLVGELGIDEATRARAAQESHPDRPAGLALLTFRRR